MRVPGPQDDSLRPDPPRQTGMVPAAMATGEGGEFRAPMAIAVIGGLLVSTVLSLIFIPSLYTLMDDLSHTVGRLFRWLVRPNASDDGDATGEDQLFAFTAGSHSGPGEKFLQANHHHGGGKCGAVSGGRATEPGAIIPPAWSFSGR